MRRPLVACALLLAIYGGLSFLNDPHAFLGTDTGGKVATLKVMTGRHRLDPDIGYWAARWDPKGRVHPLYYTSRIGRRWVNATTLPVLYAAYPLYALGGYRLALLLPMLGSVLAALAARALARRLTGGDGWSAFWLVGLASPLTIYALDFWEHSLGVAAMAWAVVALVDALAGDGRRRLVAFLGAGALFGSAATMRTEALVYAFVAVGGACILLVARRRIVAAVTGGAVAVAGFIAPLAVNYWIEVASVGEPIRFLRATGTAVAAVGGATSVQGGAAGNRLQEALLNAVGLIPAMEPTSYVVGLALLGLLVFACRRTTGTGENGPAVVAAAGVVALYLIRSADGPGFVPSLVAATPLAVAGLVHGWSTVTSRYLLVVGLAALPLVWATQFQGGAAPQWAGRYLLVSGLLFAVAGVAVLPRLRSWARRGLIGLAVTVTTFGFAWMVIRTHTVGHASAELSRRPEPVLISRVGHLAREAGAFYGDHLWLTAPSDADQRFAADVVAQAGFRRLAIVQVTVDLKLTPIPGWRYVGRDHLELVPGLGLTVATYEATSGTGSP